MTSVPSRTRGTAAASAATVVSDSWIGPVGVGVFGMKWSEYQMPSQPVSATWLEIASVDSHRPAGLGQMLNRIRSLHCIAGRRWWPGTLSTWSSPGPGD